MMAMAREEFVNLRMDQAHTLLYQAALLAKEAGQDLSPEAVRTVRRIEEQMKEFNDVFPSLQLLGPSAAPALRLE